MEHIDDFTLRHRIDDTMSAGLGGVLPRPDLFSCRFDGGLVVADPRSQRLLAYNESAGFIWNAIACGASADAAAATGGAGISNFGSVRRRLQRRIALPTPLLWTYLNTIKTRPAKLLQLFNPRKLSEQISRVPGYVKQFKWK